MNAENFLKTGSGLVLKPDTRDKVLDLEVLGAPSAEIKPLGRIEKILSSPLSRAENIIYQGNILSCVSCSAAFLNFYNSYFNDGNAAFQSWLYIYSQVPHYPGGTAVNDNLSLAKKKGICLDRTLSSALAIKNDETWAQKPDKITKEMDEEAVNFQIEGYYATELRRLALYQVLTISPILIGLRVGKNFGEGLNFAPTGDTFGHACVLVDVDENGNWLAVNWWKEDELDVRTLHSSYPLILAKVIKDKKDTLFVEKLTKKNMKLIKTASSPKVYLLDYSNRLHWLCQEDTYRQFVHKDGDFSLVEIVSDEVLASYEVGESLNMYGMSLLEIIKFWARNRKIEVE